MFKSMYDAITKTPNSSVDSITTMVSNAKQQSEVAISRLNDALCKTLDGPGCECRGLKVVGDKQ